MAKGRMTAEQIELIAERFRALRGAGALAGPAGVAGGRTHRRRSG